MNMSTYQELPSIYRVKRQLSDVDQLANDYFEKVLDLNPVLATELGRKGVETLYPDYSPAGEKALHRLAKKTLKKIDSVLPIDDVDLVTLDALQERLSLYRAQREILLDPNDPQVVAQAQANGVPHSWITAAQQSPIWKLITEYEVALPLHPEFRTLPMVWYVPPLSPVVDQVTASGSDGEDHKVLLSAISQMRIPLEYLAGLFTAGDTAPVELALRRLAAMRSYMRDVFVDNPTNEEIPASVGMTPEKVKEMYRLLSIAKYDDRFVIPTAHPEMPRGIKELEGCPVSYDVEAFHGLAPATSNRPMGGSSPEGRQMLPLEVVR